MSNKATWLRSLRWGLPRDFDFSVIGTNADVFSLLAALPNGDRGVAARTLYELRDRIGATLAYEALIEAWIHDHPFLLEAFGTADNFVKALSEVAPPIKQQRSLRVWRGIAVSEAHPGDAAVGISWTRHREVACWFACWFAPRFPSLDVRPFVFTTQLEPSAIVASHNRRNEREVMVNLAALAWASITVDGTTIAVEGLETDSRCTPRGFGEVVRRWRAIRREQAKETGGAVVSGAKDRGKKPRATSSANYEVLLDYLQLGWTPMRLPPRSKEPYDEGHDAATITRDNAKTLKANENIALRFTTAGALKDLDLDYQSAVDLAKAVGLTEGTAAFGRPSVGIGHLLYNAPGTKAKKFVLPEGEYPKPVPNVGEAHMQDHTYFAAIDEETNSGGREALLDFLLHFDLNSVNLREIPQTAALVDQKLSTLNAEQGWWLDTLVRGQLPKGCDEENSCPTERLFDDYVKHAQKLGARRRAIETQLGIFLRKHVPDLRRVEGFYDRYDRGTNSKREGVPGYVYVFPPLSECRAAFAKALQSAIAWPEGEEWTAEPDDTM